jgi:dTDP-4-amino-4,6-dideoxygalactose transaminase
MSAVPLFARSLEPYLDRLTEALERVARDGRYILGPEVEAFEEEFARYIGVRHCIGVANGTDALTIALKAAGVGPGDEVVLPSFTFYATAEAALVLGARPVYCDIDLETFNVTRETVEAAMTPNTKAIVPVHLFGNLAPVPELAELGVPVIEDAAQAVGGSLDGVKAGALGDAATFSFFPSKNLPCLGDGGALVTDDDELAELARVLRFHGSRDKRTFIEVGWNSRLDELQAAALRLFLGHVDEWNAGRRDAAARYANLGLGEACEVPRDESGHVYHEFVVRSPERDRLADGLREAGVACKAYYSVPLHLQPAFHDLGYEEGSLPESERASRETLALPIWPSISAAQQTEVVEAIRSAASVRAAT